MLQRTRGGGSRRDDWLTTDGERNVLRPRDGELVARLLRLVVGRVEVLRDNHLPDAARASPAQRSAGAGRAAVAGRVRILQPDLRARASSLSAPGLAHVRAGREGDGVKGGENGCVCVCV